MNVYVDNMFREIFKNQKNFLKEQQFKLKTTIVESENKKNKKECKCNECACGKGK